MQVWYKQSNAFPPSSARSFPILLNLICSQIWKVSNNFKGFLHSELLLMLKPYLTLAIGNQAWKQIIPVSFLLTHSSCTNTLSWSRRTFNCLGWQRHSLTCTDISCWLINLVDVGAFFERRSDDSRFTVVVL